MTAGGSDDVPDSVESPPAGSGLASDTQVESSFQPEHGGGMSGLPGEFAASAPIMPSADLEDRATSTVDAEADVPPENMGAYASALHLDPILTDSSTAATIPPESSAVRVPSMHIPALEVGLPPAFNPEAAAPSAPTTMPIASEGTKRRVRLVLRTKPRDKVDRTARMQEHFARTAALREHYQLGRLEFNKGVECARRMFLMQAEQQTLEQCITRERAWQSLQLTRERLLLAREARERAEYLMSTDSTQQVAMSEPGQSTEGHLPVSSKTQPPELAPEATPSTEPGQSTEGRSHVAPKTQPPQLAPEATPSAGPGQSTEGRWHVASKTQPPQLAPVATPSAGGSRPSGQAGSSVKNPLKSAKLADRARMHLTQLELERSISHAVQIVRRWRVFLALVLYPLVLFTLTAIADGIFWMAHVQARGIPSITLLIITGVLWLFAGSMYAVWWFFIPISVSVDADLVVEYQMAVREAKLELLRSIPILTSWFVLVSAGLITLFWFNALEFFVAEVCIFVASFIYFFVRIRRVGFTNLQLFTLGRTHRQPHLRERLIRS